MKSSFSWPGRPPAEMISRNVKRLLTSILDGTLKRGAFCTSTLDGTLKRGAFYTSILDGRLKRDAFLCTRVGAYCIRPTFLTIKINGTQIRSTKRPCKGTGSTKGDQTHDFLSPTGPFDGAYAIRPYHATSKRDAFYTSYLVATPKRGAFCTSYLVATLKRGAFLCTEVGAYCIRPTKRPRKGTGSTKGDQTCDFLSPTGPFGGAYAIRPYHATSKRDAFYTSYLLGTPKRGAFCTSYLVATLKRGAFWTSYLVATPKRGAFCTSYLVATLKRGAFCTSYLVGALKGGAFCLFYSSFLALMQEKKQKKIKASAEAGEVGRVHDRWSRGRGQVCLLFFRLLFLAYSFSYVSVLYFRSEGVHSDVS